MISNYIFTLASKDPLSLGFIPIIDGIISFLCYAINFVCILNVMFQMKFFFQNIFNKCLLTKRHNSS